jgi:hypothetical protein
MLGILLIWGFLTCLAAILVVIIMAATVDAHENGQFKHLEKGQLIGPNVLWVIVCRNDHFIFFVDTNGDQTPDEVYDVWDEHDVTHYRPMDWEEATCEGLTIY